MSMRAFTFIILSSLLLWGCRKEESAKPADPGYEYFPVKVGSWVQYQVDSAWRDDGFTIDTSKTYMLKQVIAGHYTDPAGRPALRIERFVQQGDIWVIRDVWSGTRTTSALEITEENMRRLKISFPAREGRTWDMNIYNTEPELMVAAREVDQPYQLAGHSFARSMVVRNTVPANLINSRDIEERYAEGVGLIERHTFDRTATSTLPNALVRSTRVDMVMVAYGN